MKPHCRFTMRTMLWAMLAVACLTSTPAMAGEPGWWTRQKRECNLPANLAYNNWDGQCNSSSGGSAATPSYDYGAAQRAQQAAEAAERQRQEEAARLERQRRAEEKRQKDAAFIRDRDAAANSLKGSSGSALNHLKGLSGADNSGLKGSSFDLGGSDLKGLKDRVNAGQKSRLKPAPHTDTSVVDARNVPSGLDKATENAIARAYPNAPSGVSARVRKGFQAVMDHDWKAAQAWFQDALNRDPNNAGLKRLVTLADYTQQRVQQKPVSGKPFTDEDIPPGADPQTYAMTSTKIHSQRAWHKFLFPDGKNLRKAQPVVKTLPDGRKLQLPDESDILFLFDLSGMAPAPPVPAHKPTPTFIIGKDDQLIQVPENTDQKSPTYIKGKHGALIQVPQPSDSRFLFPGNSPEAKPKKSR